jgi:hypothetical protein
LYREDTTAVRLGRLSSALFLHATAPNNTAEEGEGAGSKETEQTAKKEKQCTITRQKIHPVRAPNKLLSHPGTSSGAAHIEANTHALTYTHMHVYQRCCRVRGSEWMTVMAWRSGPCSPISPTVARREDDGCASRARRHTCSEPGKRRSTRWKA